MLGNANITTITSAFLGHEALGNGFMHDLTTAVVMGTEPAAGETVAPDSPVVLHVQG